MTMASGVYGVTHRDIWDASQLAVNTSSDTIKYALVTDAETPDFDADDFYADFSANEVSGTGYTAEGATLASITFLNASGFLSFDAADTSWTTSTITNARGGITHDDTLASGPLLHAVTFGADFSTVAGTFLVTHNASGLWRIDYIP